MRQRGGDVHARLLGYEDMASCPLLTDAGEHVRMIPSGPWQRTIVPGAIPEEDLRKQIMMILMLQTHNELTQSMSTTSLHQGYPPALVQQRTEKKLNDLSVHLFVKWLHSYATRIIAIRKIKDFNIRASTDFDEVPEITEITHTCKPYNIKMRRGIHDRLSISNRH